MNTTIIITAFFLFLLISFKLIENWAEARRQKSWDKLKLDVREAGADFVQDLSTNARRRLTESELEKILLLIMEDKLKRNPKQ